MAGVYKNILIILFIITILGIIIIGIRHNSVIGSYQDTLKVRIDSLNNEIRLRDSLYNIKSLEKDKITIIREKVTIETESKKVEQLNKELDILKAIVYRDTIKVTPLELRDYFNKILQ